ncbi:antirestriction protein ArdA [Streptomyces malaysiensis]|uniref:antirestriction protein ArdA n=1 Tax=Streptomyces malaysiensis TaxID=92644 RepID=UPI0036A84EF9
MPSIYVASLTDYNDGELHGTWVDADQDADSIMEDVQAMLATSPTARRYGTVAEEWAIHDYEDFGGVEVSEWATFEWVAELAELLKSRPAALVAYFLGEGYALGEIGEEIDARFMGEQEASSEVKAVADYHRELLEDREDIPEDLRSHLNAIATSMAEDDLHGGGVQTINLRGPNWQTWYLLSC